MDWLIDEIRICLFFENFMKAEPLDKGCVIHFKPAQGLSSSTTLRPMSGLLSTII